MITYVKGNLFESPARVLVNTVNTVGVMGKGVALTFKKLFPDMFKEYRGLCEDKRLEVGTLHLYKTPNKWVLNFPTKKHWRQPSKLEYVRAGLATLSRIHGEAGIQSIALPPLGCGNGQLDFEGQVKPLMEEYLAPLPIDAFVYPERPGQVPEQQDLKAMSEWLRAEPESLAFDEVWVDVCELLRERSEFQTVSSRTQYTVEAIEDPPTLVVRASRSYKVDYDELLDLWQQLRQHGFVYQRLAPKEHRLHYVMPVLQELAYVELVEVSDAKGRAVAALQLRPRSRALSIQDGRHGELFVPNI